MPKTGFHYVEFCSRSGIFLCLMIPQVELIKKAKEKFHSTHKIPPYGVMENWLNITKA